MPPNIMFERTDMRADGRLRVSELLGGHGEAEMPAELSKDRI